MYESPINLIYKDYQTQMKVDVEKLILEATQEVGVVVDKDELIKALNYDRQQYEKGYVDGKKVVLDKIEDEIKEWYWSVDKQELAKDPCVVDAMISLFIITIKKYREVSE